MKKNIKKIWFLFLIILAVIFLIRLILSNTSEIYQHNIGTSGNRVFISPDGHNEVVFDIDGKSVQDPINMPSYNYKHPINEPFGHLFYDTFPWIIWWNSLEDTSSSFVRLLAFLKDFWNGISTTFQKALWWKVENNVIQNGFGDDSAMSEKIIQAREYFSGWKYQEAIVEYESILEQSVANDEIMNNLFISYVYTNEFQKAINVIYFLVDQVWPIEEIVWYPIEKNNISKLILENYEKQKNDPSNIEWYLLEYAQLAYQAGDEYYEEDKERYFMAIMLHYLSAYLSLEELLSINPESAEAYFYQGRLIMDINESFSLSEEKLLKAVELKDDHFEYYYRLWNAYRSQKKYDEAIEVYKKWIDLNKDYPKLYLNLGLTYSYVKKFEIAIDTLMKAVPICDENCYKVYSNLWYSHYSMNNHDEAKKWYEKVIEIKPDHIDANKALGILK